MQRFVGRKMRVLWEQVTGASDNGFRNVGLTDNYIRVVLDTPEVLTNKILLVTLVEAPTESTTMIATAVVTSG